MATRLAAADPANTGWQRDLSVSHDKLGDIAVAAGDLTTARTSYQAALNIATRLAGTDSTQAGLVETIEHRLAQLDQANGHEPSTDSPTVSTDVQ